MYTTGVASGGPSGRAFAGVFARGTAGFPGREKYKNAVATVAYNEQLINRSRNRVARTGRSLKLEGPSPMIFGVSPVTLRPRCLRRKVSSKS